MSETKHSLYEMVEDFVMNHPIHRRNKCIDIDDIIDNIPNYEIVEFFEQLYSHILD